VTRFEEQMVVAPLHGFDPTAPPAFDLTLVRGGLLLSQVLVDGGARRSRVRVAEAATGEAEAALASSEMTLLARVAEAFLQTRTLREVLDAHGSRIRALTEERDRVSRFLDQGRAARVELLRAEAALSQARADEHSSAARLEVSERELARLIGIDVGAVTDRPLANVSVRGTGLPEPAMESAEELPTTTPEVERARERVRGAEAALAAARATWFPEIRAGGAYNKFGSGEGSFTGEWQAALQISYPLFTGGGRGASVERASAGLRRAREELRLAELRYGFEVDQFRAAVVEADARTEALSAAVSQFEEVARMEALVLDAGAGVQRDLLEAEAALFGARAALAESRHAAVAARINLARARGILTLAWLDENVESEP
jgi:outer membrane protein TolC